MKHQHNGWIRLLIAASLSALVACSDSSHSDHHDHHNHGNEHHHEHEHEGSNDQHNKVSYVKATIPGMSASSAYFEWCNTSMNDYRITGVSSDVTAKAELHTMDMSGETMIMRQLEELLVKAGHCAIFQPGSDHIMLLDLAEPIIPGQTVLITLQLAADSEDAPDTLEIPMELIAK